MRVFLTGGTGLVGSHVAERLVREGHRVRALVRPTSATAHLSSLGVELRYGDVAEIGTFGGTLEGCDGVIHAAALVVPRGPPELFRSVNELGTAHVLGAAAERGIERAVHVSSVAVYGADVFSRIGPVDEDTPWARPLPPAEVYARSKRDAERAAWSIHERGPLGVTVVRPDLVYGERDRVVIPRIARHVKAPVSVTVGRGDRPLPLVYAGNIAGAIVAALTVPSAAGRVYNLTTDFPITQRELFELVARGMGRRPPPFLPVPYTLAYSIARAVEGVSRVLGRTPPVTRRNVAVLGAGNPFVSERARRELGWAPEVEHDVAVPRAVRWYLGAREGMSVG